MRDYQEFYNHLTLPLRDKPSLLYWVNGLNSLITKLIYLLYPIFLAAVWLKHYQMGLSLEQTFFNTLPYLLIPAGSFLLVSLLRRYLNCPRPYERWEIDTLIPKDTKGNSMPSRHVFSATIIAMCVLENHLWLGLTLLLLALVLGVLRVLGGVHYPRDVFAGFLIGLMAGGLLWLV